MEKTIFIISDLHLGGKPGFQICSPAGQQRLAQFIRWAKEQHTTEHTVQLVIAGDIVDFLAEEDFQAFTADDVLASQKLENIFKNFAGVWEALREFVASGAELTMMVGNHDIELSLPGPHRLLREKLGQGRVDFIFDNQAFVAGPVIIEHGNRYDMWNVVPHDELRQVRSALSRREQPPPLTPIPGSQLVCQVMNQLKQKYHFIDLLKPETQAALPLMALLEPEALREIDEVAKLYLKARQVKFNAQGVPTDRGKISAVTTPCPQEIVMRRILTESRELGGGDGDNGQISALGKTQAFINLWRAARSKSDRDKQIDRLYRALKTFAAEQHLAFDLAQEDEIYLEPARHLAKRGFQVVVFGHTHLVKRVPLRETQNAIYLNSGTWADILRLPSSLLQDDETTAKAELQVFADDLAQNQLGNMRKPVASYVRIDLGGEQVKSAEVFHFESSKKPASSILKHSS